MPDEEPRWRRRKEARPAEIIDAALAVFADQGFAAAKLDEIARRAGVSKAALYLYFETKEELFRAAARRLVAPQLEAIAGDIESLDPPFAEAVPLLLGRAAIVMSEGQAGRLARMVIGESRNFPDLARIWRADVVDRMLDVLSGLVARAQSRGEVAPGDPRLHAFTIMGPLVLGALYNAVFGDLGGERCDLPALAAQHAGAVIAGLAPPSHVHPES
jgi:AcrR family transcriptional regulator